MKRKRLILALACVLALMALLPALAQAAGPADRATGFVVSSQRTHAFVGDDIIFGQWTAKVELFEATDKAPEHGTVEFGCLADDGTYYVRRTYDVSAITVSGNEAWALLPVHPAMVMHVADGGGNATTDHLSIYMITYPLIDGNLTVHTAE